MAEYKYTEVKNGKMGDSMSKMQYKQLAVAVATMLLVVMFFVGREAAAFVAGRSVNETQLCVVIDAGHGGDDPGKVGINGVKEKDINLEIAKLLKQFLEAADVKVVMTREDEEGLYDAGASNKKVQDMKRRVEIISEAKPVATVSIHQNSYPEEYVRGAQVFYYTNSQEGMRLAGCIQKQLIQRADTENTRQIKANDSYYLLKKAEGPIVIAECGFLSNWSEAEMLCEKEYQQKIAWAIHIGILQYLNGVSGN